MVACSRLSVSGVDGKSRRGTSGVWWKKIRRAREGPSLFLYLTPLVARRPTALEQATPKRESLRDNADWYYG